MHSCSPYGEARSAAVTTLPKLVGGVSVVPNAEKLAKKDIRVALLGKAEVLMGKNTVIRKGLQIGHNEFPYADLDKLRAYLKGNLGFIFATNCILDEIRDVLAENRRWQGAKAGQFSNVDLVLPSGPTGMDPSHTSFFQLFSIGTKIVKGQIELTSDFPLLKVGSKVSSSVQALLHGVFQDGALFDAAVLDIKSDVLVTKFMARIANVAAFGQEVGIPSEAGMPQMFANGFKMLLRLFLTSTTSPAKIDLKNAVMLVVAIGIFLLLGPTKQFLLMARFLLARIAGYQAVWGRRSRTAHSVDVCDERDLLYDSRWSIVAFGMVNENSC